MSDTQNLTFDNVALVSIRQLRERFKFVIPEYQRGFAWDEAQWNDLWRDTVGASRRERFDHFSGSLMLRTTGTENFRQEVVDGQQRLTSMALLLRALGEGGLDIEFQNNEPLQVYFDHFTRDTGAASPRLGMYRSFYARNVQSAATFFLDKATALTEEQRKKLGATLLDRFKVFMLAIHPSFDIHMAFETINNRGRPLSILEKLKNRLIYLCSAAEDAAAGRAAAHEVHTAWKTIYHWLGRGEKLLEDDEFLRAHAVGWFRKEHQAEWLTRRLFDEDFSENLPAQIIPALVPAYVRSLERAAAWWYYLNHPDDLPPSASKALRSLERAGAGNALPMLLWALQRCADGDDELAVLPNAKQDWVEPFAGLVWQAERYSVVVVKANGRISSVGQSDFNRLTYALAHPGTKVWDEMTDAPPKEGGAAVAYVEGYVRAMVSNTEDGDGASPRLDGRFYWEGAFSRQKFLEVLADRLRSGRGFYDWDLGKLLIFEWEQHLRGDSGLPEKRPWDRFGWDDSIEHIYPQTPEEGWKHDISLDERSRAVRAAVCNSLGNLLYLSRSRNSSVSNALYSGNADPSRDKRQRYAGGSYSEWQVATVCPGQWTVNAIAARGIAMMRHAQRHWDFELIPDSDRQWGRWLPVLFGDAADKIREGAASNGVAVDGRSLRTLVERFECVKPG